MSLRNGAGPAPAATGGEARKNVGSGNARSSKAHSQNPQVALSWRNVLPVHPAAELFPLMSQGELRDLGADIRKNGLTMPIVLWKGDRMYVLDGRNRLDGIEVAYGSAVQALLPAIVTTDQQLVGGCNKVILLDETVDPFEYVLSVNLRRRHLTPEQRRELIAKLLKATPSKSDRQIAKTVKVSPTTVGTVRAAMEATGDVSKLDTRKDSKGRHQPARKAERPKRTPQEQRAAIDGAVEGIQRGIVTGTKMSPHAERGLDCYETAPATVRALLDVESLSGTIWEPACGPGSIVTTLRAAGHHVVATDIESYACPDSLGGVDFLKQTSAPKGAQTILTNPPFMRADAFVRHALTLVPRVIMLLRLAFLESKGRSDILDGGQLARVLVFRNRLAMMHRANWEGPKIDSGAVAFAWFIWDRNHGGPTELKRLSWKPVLPTPPVASQAHDLDDGIPDFLRRSAP